ncbi:hypothetical protein [Vulgatibacter sp.]|uniref:hypothetical protein n=1 Tax=Vulgatibacter sp. TaxID=1971226 RepID=UPI003561FEC8
MRGALIAIAFASLCTLGCPPGSASSEAERGGSPGAAGSQGEGGTGGQVAAGGSAGATAPGGAGGVATGGSGGTAAEVPAWILAEETWQPLPGAAYFSSDCRIEQGRAERLEAPPLRWEPCGSGCERADVVAGLGEFAATAELTSRVVGGESRTYLAVSNVLPETPLGLVVIDRHIDLSDGTTFAALRRTRAESAGGSCLGSLLGEQSLGRKYSFGDDGTVMEAIGLLDPETGAWRWLAPWTPLQQIGIWYRHALEATGHLVVGHGGNLRASREAGSTELVEVDPLEAVSLAAAISTGTQVVWSELERSEIGSRLRSWAPGNDEPTLRATEPDADVCRVAAGDATLATWAVVPDGLRGCDLDQPGGRFRLIGTDGQQHPTSPILDEKLFVSALATWGDHVAAVVHHYRIPDEDLDEYTHVLLAQGGAWVARRIASLPDHTVHKIALTDRHLYVTQTPLGMHYRRVDAVYRYDLASFESIGTPFGWDYEPRSE